jgi:hypothetical protein
MIGCSRPRRRLLVEWGVYINSIEASPDNVLLPSTGDLTSPTRLLEPRSPSKSTMTERPESSGRRECLKRSRLIPSVTNSRDTLFELEEVTTSKVSP